MKTVFIKEFGGRENLEIREIAEPNPPQWGEVLVRVSLAGINRADILQRRGLYPPPEGFDPHQPGLEFAGGVIAIGDGVNSFSIGDSVAGITSGEAQSELVVVDQRLIFSSEGIEAEAAGAIPEIFVTAHDALVSQANVAAGETVLIHAIASGVGLAAAQIAKLSGATVIGTTRNAEKAEKLAEFSAFVDHVVVTSDGPVFADEVFRLTDGRGADVVIDLVGGEYFPEELRAMAPKGRIILVGLTAGRKAELDMGLMLGKRLTVKGTVLRSRSTEEKAAAIAAFRKDLLPHLKNGELYPVIDSVFPLEQISEAHGRVEADENIGKVLIAFPHVEN